MGLYLGKEKISNVASVVTQNADSMVTKMQNHITDTDIHITADERTKWNAAAENTEDFASTGVMNTNINMNNNSIKNLATPIENNDAANKGYVDSKALPATSASDNGKVLSVVNGAWAAAAISSGAYIGSYAGDGSSSKTLTFNFKPGAIFIVGVASNGTNYTFISFRGCNKILEVDGETGNITWGNTNVVLDNKDTHCNLFVNRCAYYYAVIPAMN